MPMRKIWNNQYEQLRKIGEGASGRVMLARDLHLNRLVAIKEMEQIREIRREMELLKALKHPGLPDISGDGICGGSYVKGVSGAAWEAGADTGDCLDEGTPGHPCLSS